jgi:hypothetical protein
MLSPIRYNMPPSCTKNLQVVQVVVAVVVVVHPGELHQSPPTQIYMGLGGQWPPWWRSQGGVGLRNFSKSEISKIFLLGFDIFPLYEERCVSESSVRETARHSERHREACGE